VRNERKSPRLPPRRGKRARLRQASSGGAGGNGRGGRKEGRTKNGEEPGGKRFQWEHTKKRVKEREASEKAKGKKVWRPVAQKPIGRSVEGGG